MTIFDEAARMEAENRSFALATIVSARGSTPRNSGRMIIRADGSTTGTVGGGPMELFVIEQAAEALRAGVSRTVTRDLVSTGKRAAGMECGGTMEVLIDVVLPRPKLLLVGGGHVNLAIAEAAEKLGYDIAVAENRAEFASAERFPMARRIFLNEDILAALGEAEIDPGTAVVIATASEDLRVLETVMKSPASYVGMLGSKRKVALAVARLREIGIPEERIGALHSPVGLDIGAETPAEIAVSIHAELLGFRSSRQGGSLCSLVHDLVVIRGAGDLATGCAWRLRRAGFRIVCLEVEKPSVIRRTVSFAEALYAGEAEVEGIRAVRAANLEEVYTILESGDIPVFADPEGESLEELKPAVLVDAILAKRNLGTRIDMAPLTIALGPGFTAGRDVDAVIETNRGHNLGRVILSGEAEANTGVPGTVGGESSGRVVRAPAAGIFEPRAAIGDLVKTGEILATVGQVEVPSPLDGLVRGLLAAGLEVNEGFKIGDVDPRGAAVDWRTISDKARSVAGGVLEALLYLRLRERSGFPPVPR
jgi:xanthine dehydrogenase accessory factor